MKTLSRNKVALIGLVLASAVVAGCGDGGKTAESGAAASPAPVAATPAPVAAAPVAGTPAATPATGVPANISDSPSLFVAFVKALTSTDDTSEALTVPDLTEAGDDAAEPQVLGA